MLLLYIVCSIILSVIVLLKNNNTIIVFEGCSEGGYVAPLRLTASPQFPRDR